MPYAGVEWTGRTVYFVFVKILVSDLAVSLLLKMEMYSAETYDATDMI